LVDATFDLTMQHDHPSGYKGYAYDSQRNRPRCGTGSIRHQPSDQTDVGHYQHALPEFQVGDLFLEALKLRYSSSLTVW